MALHNKPILHAMFLKSIDLLTTAQKKTFSKKNRNLIISSGNALHFVWSDLCQTVAKIISDNNLSKFSALLKALHWGGCFAPFFTMMNSQGVI